MDANRKVGLLGAVLLTVIFTFIQPSSAASDLSDGYGRLFLLVTILSFLVLVLVVGLWVYLMYKYNEKNEDVDRTPLSHSISRRLEFGWTAVATVIVIFLIIFSFPVIFGDTNQSGDPNALDGEIIVVRANNNWQWSYYIPETNTTILPTQIQQGTSLVAQSNITLEVGTRYSFILYNVGTFIHSYFVNGLNLKMDVVPGVNNTISFTIEEAGEYEVLCTEYCGFGHSLMRGWIIAE